jgi:membrane protease YdiL (CAAX protease family)
MYILGQDKNSMALQRHAQPVISQGWIRAILLLVAYITISVAGSYLVPTLFVWLVLSFLISIVLVYIFRLYIDRRTFKSLGFSLSHIYPDAFIGVASGVFLVTLGALVIYVAKGLEWIDLVMDKKDLFLSFGILLMIAFSEELVFRGYILHNLMKTLNKWLALLTSSLIFTVIHFSNLGIHPLGLINTFLAGLLLGITYILTRNLWLPIAFHFSWNFVQGPILGFKVSGFSFHSLLSMEVTGNEILTGGEYGFEGSIVCTVLLALSFTACCYLMHKKTYVVIGT